MSKPASTRDAVLLSALVPGLGQVIQRRWISAAVHAVLFNWFAVVLIVRVFRLMMQSFRAALDFADRSPNSSFGEIPLKQILIPFGLSMLFWFSGLIDTAWAARRAAARREASL